MCTMDEDAGGDTHKYRDAWKQLDQELLTDQNQVGGEGRFQSGQPLRKECFQAEKNNALRDVVKSSSWENLEKILFF